MSSTKNPGRFAGLLYILFSIPGFFAIVYVPSKLIVHGNAAATANNISANETLFRLGIAGQLISQAGWIFVAVALYHLLKGVNRWQASLWVILVVASIPIGFLNELNSIAALAFVRGADFLSIVDKPQREALAMPFFNLHSQGMVVVEQFWGLDVVALALLVYRSRFLPRFLGVWLAIDGLAYVILSFTGVLSPQYLRPGAYLHSARHLRGGGLHAVARHQGCQAASAGRYSLIIGSWLGRGQKPHPENRRDALPKGVVRN